MKNLFIICLCLTSPFIFVSFGYTTNPSELEISTLDEVQEQFANPPAAYRPAPLYVWNGDMQEDEIAWQLDEFKKEGFGGVFVHPRPGLITPYLSERWLELWRFTAEEADKRGMVTYIYDENSYPSGFAGGHVPERLPEMDQISLQRQEFPPEKLDQLQLSADTIALYRVTNSEKGEYKRVALPLNAAVEEKNAKDLGLEPATYILYNTRHPSKSPWYGGRNYVDLMRPEVAEAFLDITLGSYDTALSDLYGKVVLACFTDEPQVAGCWSKILPEEFKKRWGYDILDHLPSLHADMGDWRRIRHDYAATILDLFINNFAKPYYEACDIRDLPATGHVWEHGWPAINHNPDVMSFNAWQHWPGIDCLMNQYSEGPHAQFGNYRANKEIDSIANQFGRIRKLCEAYGAGGWELRLEDMKRIGDFLYAGGVNLLNPHLSYYTIRGARKRDHPQSFSYHAPYWEAYHLTADYFGRLSWALAAGKERNPILVIQPTTTMWMYNWSGTQREKLEQLGSAFQSYITELGATHVAFDLGSEPVMADHADVHENQLIIGECAYDLVILPPGLENLESTTVNLLEKYVKNGGKIISCVGVPPYIDCIPNDRVQKIKQLAGSRWMEDDHPPQYLAQTYGNAGVLITSTPPEEGRVYHHLRELEDGYLLFISNTSLKESSTGQVAAYGKYVERWNPEDGTIVSEQTMPPFHTGNAERDTMLWDFELPPAGSVLFAIHREGKPTAKQPEKAIVNDTPLKTVGEMKIERLEPNVVPLDYVDLVLNGEVTEGLYFYNAQTLIYQAHGMQKNPWDSGVQFKDEIIQQDHFPPNSGFELRYPFQMGSFGSMPSLQLVVERGDRYTVSVNGHTIEAEQGEWWLDRSFTVYKIQPNWLEEGRNVISTKAKPFTLHHEPEPVYLLGDFNLTSIEKGWRIDPPEPLELGSWPEQGLPCYPHTVAYTRKYVINKNNQGHIVKLHDWTGTVARVDVNGKSAGYIGWQPWELDISDFVKEGENTVSVIVFGSLKNLLGPHHNGPVRGSAWPGMFHRAPEEGQPAGDRYDVIGYGLHSPFKVY